LPVNPGQAKLQLDVFQGESPMVERNIKLGELEVDIDPARAAQENAVDLRFTYDVNGVLQVEARVQSTGKHYELVLEQNPGVLSPEQIRTRLAALADIKIHPRSKQENLALLARVERIYEEHLALREQVQGWIAQFRAVLETQDERLIRDHRIELARALDALESS
jgi:molecular chaperone HscC